MRSLKECARGNCKSVEMSFTHQVAVILQCSIICEKSIRGDNWMFNLVSLLISQLSIRVHAKKYSLMNDQRKEGKVNEHMERGSCPFPLPRRTTTGFTGNGRACRLNRRPVVTVTLDVQIHWKGVFHHIWLPRGQTVSYRLPTPLTDFFLICSK